MNEADKFLQDYLAQEQRKTQQTQATPPRGTPVNPRPSYGVNARVQQTKQSESAYYQASATPPPKSSYAASQGEQYSVSMGEAIKRFWSNWSTDGRASRSEYWKWMLVNLIVFFILGFISGMMQWDDRLLSGLWSLAIFGPSIAIIWRRLHDTGRSGAWFWISFIPFIGWIILWILLAIPSDPHENQYGPVPNVR